ncbi:MAG: hypothetical protein CM1200mP20_02100 [Pseudomonadota bacterium]|nr:MAG: hypothetical protein CM1200mP20_02100 [Pseudomonadota bacterium]
MLSFLPEERRRGVTLFSGPGGPTAPRALQGLPYPVSTLKMGLASIQGGLVQTRLRYSGRAYRRGVGPRSAVQRVIQLENPQGTLAAGFPLALNGKLNGVQASMSSTVRAFGSGATWLVAKAVTAVAGVSNKS